MTLLLMVMAALGWLTLSTLVGEALSRRGSSLPGPLPVMSRRPR